VLRKKLLEFFYKGSWGKKPDTLCIMNQMFGGTIFTDSSDPDHSWNKLPSVPKPVSAGGKRDEGFLL